ncbi:MAG: hypothetical protein U1D55_11180 [Phycisphaerae bacterium]
MSAANNPVASLKIECRVRFAQKRRTRKELCVVDGTETVNAPLGRIPRISRLMALAIRFERLVAIGEVRDYAELASLGHVTRARVTQIMGLLCLAPAIQEDLLFLPLVEHGREPIKEWMIRPIAATPEWSKQRRLWRELTARPVS